MGALRVFDGLARSLGLRTLIQYKLAQTIDVFFVIFVVGGNAVRINGRSEVKEANQNLPDLHHGALLAVLANDAQQLHDKDRRNHRQPHVGLSDKRIGLIIRADHVRTCCWWRRELFIYLFYFFGGEES